MRILMWKHPYDRRHGGDFKLIDLVSAKILMEDCLCNGQEYIIPDVNNPEMYYTLAKDDEGQVTYAHTEYGWFKPQLMQYDDIDKKIYKARKSINNYFFKREEY